MTAAILCPGPSLPTYDGTGDVRIGVNRAATAFECGYWVAIDLGMVKHHRDKLLGTPQIWTDTQQVRKFGGNDFNAIPCTADKKWRWYSMTVAIVLGIHLGETHTDIWGCDWAGTKDFDGTEAGECRTDFRWQRERTVYHQLRDWATNQGIEIVRR